MTRGAGALLACGLLAAAACAFSVSGAPAKSAAPAVAQEGVTLYFNERDEGLIRGHFRRAGTVAASARESRLPGELEARLAPLPPGYERVIGGRDVMLIQAPTRLVLDRLRDVVKAGVNIPVWSRGPARAIRG